MRGEGRERVLGRGVVGGRWEAEGGRLLVKSEGETRGAVEGEE